MSIHLTLQHALGKHTYVASPRGLDAPVLVGRGPRCDVVVPSAAVSIKHLAIFVFKGRWAAQDLRSRNGTFINDARLEQPTYLRAGDVISLGLEDDPPTLTVGAIDADAAERWVPAVASVSKPQARSAATSSASAAASVGGFPSSAITAEVEDAADRAGETAAFATSAPLPEAGAFVPPPEPEVAEWVAPVAGSVRKKRRRRNSVLPTLLLMALVAAGIGFAGWKVYEKYGPPKVAEIAPPPAPALPPAPPKKVEAKKGLFERSDKPKPKPAVEPLPPSDGALAAGPSEADRAWAQVLDAGRMSPPKVSLWLLIQYRSTYSDDLPADFQLTETGLLDRLWWDRVATLAQRRKTLAGEVAAAEQEVVQTPLSEVDRRTKLAVKRDDLKQRLAEAERSLSGEMEYAGEGLVDPSDEGQLKVLRASRDPSLFRDWSDRVENTLRRTAGGKLPW